MILVTGSTGMLGQAVTQQLVNNNISFIRSTVDLTDIQAVQSLFDNHKIICIIHLAAKVGGLFKNMNNNLQYLHDNFLINYNVLSTAMKYKVPFVISISSTCIFPEDMLNTKEVTYDDIHYGLPHKTNIGYAYGKRIIEILNDMANDQGLKYISLIPPNLYGEHDNYHIEDAHVIPALIHKMYLAQQKGEDIILPGDGSAIRQFLYVQDLAKIIVQLIKKYNIDPDSVRNHYIITHEEFRIKELVDKIKCYMNFTNNITFSNDELYNGQSRKVAIADYPLDDNFQYTNIDDGLKNTIQWFKANYNHIRR